MQRETRASRGLTLILGAAALVGMISIPAAAGEAKDGLVKPGIAREVADTILDDARSRLPPGSSDPEIASVEPAVWPDMALGCPRSDEVAATRVTSGYRVLVRAGDEIMEYHVADEGFFRLCLVGTRAPEPVAHPYPDPQIPRDDRPER